MSWVDLLDNYENTTKNIIKNYSENTNDSDTSDNDISDSDINDSDTSDNDSSDNDSNDNDSSDNDSSDNNSSDNDSSDSDTSDSDTSDNDSSDNNNDNGNDNDGNDKKMGKVREILGDDILIMNERYMLGKEIGSGASGFVYFGYDILKERIVVLKKVKITTKTTANKIGREIGIPLHLRPHPNVINIFDSFIDEVTGSYFLVYEYIPNVTDLSSVTYKNIKDIKNISVIDQLLRLLLQISSTFDYMHAKNVIHRDIKPTNILIESPYDGKLKQTWFSGTTNTIRPIIIDFDLSCVPESNQFMPLVKNMNRPTPGYHFNYNNYNNNINYNYNNNGNNDGNDEEIKIDKKIMQHVTGKYPCGASFVGTPLYAAPEIWLIDDKRPNNNSINFKKADIYSLGATFYELVNGKIPYDDGTESLSAFKYRVLNTPLEPSNSGNKELDMIIEKMLIKNPNDRILLVDVIGELAGLLKIIQEKKIFVDSMEPSLNDIEQCISFLNNIDKVTYILNDNYINILYECYLRHFSSDFNKTIDSLIISGNPVQNFLQRRMMAAKETAYEINNIISDIPGINYNCDIDHMEDIFAEYYEIYFNKIFQIIYPHVSATLLLYLSHPY